MRIKENIEGSGYFWLPSNPDRKIPGTLKISDGGNIELEVIGLFDESIEGLNKALNVDMDDTIEKVLGDIEKFGPVTLQGCFYKTKTISIGGISKSLISANRAFIGVGFKNKEEVKFNTFTFSIEGIDEWVNISGIQINNDFKNKKYTINYSPPEEISIALKNGMELQIIFSYTVPFAPKIKEAKFTQKTYFKLVSKQGSTFDDFISIAHKVTTLLCFAIDDIVCIDDVSLASNKILRKIDNGRTRPYPIKTYYPSYPYSTQVAKIEPYQMLFQFNDIKNKIELIFDGWLNAYEIIEPSLNLYFSTKVGAYKYLDSKFLALIQAIESYHRRTSDDKRISEEKYLEIVKKLIACCPEEDQDWLNGKLKYANEISLAQRLKRVIEPYKEIFGNTKDRNIFIRKAVDTRNYLTHYDKSLKSNMACGEDMWKLFLKMEVIFQLYLLQILGLSKKEIEKILNSNDKLQNKLNKSFRAKR